MTIRFTTNATIISTKKHHSAVVGKGESIHHVLAGASEALAVMAEGKDSVARAVFQTTTPGSEHNGTRE